MFWLWFFLCRLTASGAELCIGRQIFAAFYTLLKNELLMSAKRAEFRIYGNGIVAIRTQRRLRRICLGGFGLCSSKIL
jgi:hypothetical protein